MELLYFISGIIVAGFTYGAFLLRRAHMELNQAMDAMQSFKNIASIRSTELLEEIEGVRGMMLDIKEDMEASSYDTVANINKRLELLEKIEDTTGRDLKSLSMEVERAFSKTSTDIQTLKTNFKALSQDPNFLNRY